MGYSLSGEVFPSQHAEGSAKIPYIPTDQEMKNCGYANHADKECPRKKGEKQLIVGGPAPLIDCASCPLHPGNIPSRKEESVSRMQRVPHR